MCLNFKLGGLTSSCPHLSNPADVGIDPQQLDKLSPTNTQLCRKPQSVHVVYRLVVSSGCDVRLSSAQSCWQDYWTIMSHNKHHTGDSFTSYVFPVFSDSSEDGNIRWIDTLTDKKKPCIWPRSLSCLQPSIRTCYDINLVLHWNFSLRTGFSTQFRRHWKHFCGEVRICWASMYFDGYEYKQG